MDDEADLDRLDSDYDVPKIVEQIKEAYDNLKPEDCHVEDPIEEARRRYYEMGGT